MSTSVCNITVAYERSTVDVSLPAYLPVADVLPALLRYLPDGAAATRGAQHWALSPIGDAPLAYETTLEQAGVTDGAILLLTAVQHAPAPARQEHLLDIVADHLDATTSRWSATATGTLLTTTAAVIGPLLLVTSPVLTSHEPAAVTAAATMTVLCAIAAVAASARARIGAAVLLISAAGQAAALAWLWAGRGTAVPALAAVTVAVVAAAAARGLRRSLDGPALAILTFAAPLAAAWTLADPRGPAVMSVVVLLVVGVLPRLSAGAGGLAALDYRLRSLGRVEAADVSFAVRRSARLLTWALTGLCAAAAVLGLALIRSAQLWPLTLAAIVGAALMIRARLFTRVSHVLPPLLAGIITSLGVGIAGLTTTSTDAQAFAAVAGGAIAVLAATVGTRRVREATAARLRQLTGIAEAILITACIPVLAQTLGLFTAFADLLR